MKATLAGRVIAQSDDIAGRFGFWQEVEVC